MQIVEKKKKQCQALHFHDENKKPSFVKRGLCFTNKLGLFRFVGCSVSK